MTANCGNSAEAGGMTVDSAQYNFEASTEDWGHGHRNRSLHEHKSEHHDQVRGGLLARRSVYNDR